MPGTRLGFVVAIAGLLTATAAFAHHSFAAYYDEGQRVSIEGEVVAFAHGGPIRAAVGLALGLTPEVALRVFIANLSVTRLDHISFPGTPAAWRVSAVNAPPVPTSTHRYRAENRAPHARHLPRSRR